MSIPHTVDALLKIVVLLTSIFIELFGNHDTEGVFRDRACAPPRPYQSFVLWRLEFLTLCGLSTSPLAFATYAEELEASSWENIDQLPFFLNFSSEIISSKNFLCDIWSVIVWKVLYTNQSFDKLDNLISPIFTLTRQRDIQASRWKPKLLPWKNRSRSLEQILLLNLTARTPVMAIQHEECHKMTITTSPRGPLMALVTDVVLVLWRTRKDGLELLWRWAQGLLTTCNIVSDKRFV